MLVVARRTLHVVAEVQGAERYMPIPAVPHSLALVHLRECDTVCQLIRFCLSMIFALQTAGDQHMSFWVSPT